MSKELKLLSIHGYMQNAEIFRKRTGAFRKLFKKKVLFDFVTAPNKIPANEESEKDLTGWWFSSKEKSYLAQDKTDYSEGLNESLNKIAEELQSKGPFDGILAFSQGAALLGIICCLKEKGDERFQNFKFAILVAGYKSRQTEHGGMYVERISTPTLHVIGDTDQVIPRDMSDDLLTIFENPQVLRHDGGHFIPSTSSHKQTYLQFLDQFLQKC
uniref:Esterase OVCA2 n=1 Tax=Phallusia mammillata TaxID=59560 RepID=A0A6F9DNY0_9ASCI|nr:esterase OVCA2 [Phallusia mammillata]